MTSYSPYADPESGPPNWRPGAEDAAVAFLALTFYLILDVNIGIHRVFKKKQGLYFWSLVIATWACAADTIGILLKNLRSNWGPKIWPFWTVLILCGWSLFATAECLILYSRLHLVNQSPKVQRRVLIMIVIGSFALVVPNWVTMFPAYDVNPKISSIWSPRMAIVDRTSQLGFSLIEGIISGIYILSLAKILGFKPNVRQRRVMFDLIYVNIIVISVDIVVTVLIFLNQASLAYAMQVFSYALKFKLEFVVLNQLMAVAAKGLKKNSFAERRYHTHIDGLSTKQASEGSDRFPLQTLSGSNKSSQSKTKTSSSPAITAPSPLHTQQRKTPRDAYERMNSETDIEGVSGESKRLDASSFDIHLKSAAGYHPDNRSQPLKTNVTATRHLPKRGEKQREEGDDNEEDEIGVHMWEKHGKLVLDVPWLKDRNGI